MGDLFGVAASKGLEHLMSDQIGGAHQVPVEAIRLLRSWGGEAVTVDVRRRGFVVHGRGARMPNTAAALWNQALTDDATALGAMAEIEDAGWQLPMWAVGSGALGIAVVDHGRDAFVWRTPPAWRPSGAVGGDGVTIRIAIRLVTRRSRSAVRRACRHAPFPVALDGEDVRSPLGGGVFRVHLVTPAPAEVVLGVEDDMARIALLRHGVVAARVSIPGDWPPLNAAVDVTGLTVDPCAAADCRDAVRPILRALAEEAVAAGLRVTDRLLELPDGARGRMITFFLRAAAQGIRPEAVRAAPLLPLRRAGGVCMVSLDDVASGGWQRRARSGAHADDDGLVLGAEEAALVSAEIGRTLEPPRIWPPAKSDDVLRVLMGWVRAVLTAVPTRALVETETRIAEAVPWIAAPDGSERPPRLVVVRGRTRPVRIGGHAVVVGRASAAMKRALSVLQNTDDARLAALAVLPPGFRVRLTA
jgi:hypothetical protein